MSYNFNFFHVSREKADETMAVDLEYRLEELFAEPEWTEEILYDFFKNVLREEQPDDHESALIKYRSHPRFVGNLINEFQGSGGIIADDSSDSLFAEFFARLADDTGVQISRGSYLEDYCDAEVMGDEPYWLAGDPLPKCREVLVKWFPELQASPDLFEKVVNLLFHNVNGNYSVAATVENLNHYIAAADALDNGTFAELFPTANSILDGDDIESEDFESTLEEWCGGVDMLADELRKLAAEHTNSASRVLLVLTNDMGLFSAIHELKGVTITETKTFKGSGDSTITFPESLTPRFALKVTLSYPSDVECQLTYVTMYHSDGTRFKMVDTEKQLPDITTVQTIGILQTDQKPIANIEVESNGNWEIEVFPLEELPEFPSSIGASISGDLKFDAFRFNPQQNITLEGLFTPYEDNQFSALHINFLQPDGQPICMSADNSEGPCRNIEDIPAAEGYLFLNTYGKGKWTLTVHEEQPQRVSTRPTLQEIASALESTIEELKNLSTLVNQLAELEDPTPNDTQQHTEEDKPYSSSPAEVAVLPLEGLQVCISGAVANLSRNEVNDAVKRLGGIPVSSVSKNTDILVCEADSTTSKAEKARQLGVRIINPSEFAELL